MTTSVSEHIEQASDELSAEVCDQLVKRRGGAFASMGAPAARRLVARLLAALAADVEHGANEQTRRAVTELLDVPQPVQIGWHDLRLLITSLRKALFARLDNERDTPPSATRALEDLLSHATFQIGLWFVTQREEIIEKQAGQLEVRLAELAALDAEKTRVLEQAQELSQRLDSILANVPALVWETRFGDGSATRDEGHLAKRHCSRGEQRLVGSCGPRQRRRRGDWGEPRELQRHPPPLLASEGARARARRREGSTLAPARDAPRPTSRGTSIARKSASARTAGSSPRREGSSIVTR